jgi:hypothetical protein
MATTTRSRSNWRGALAVATTEAADCASLLEVTQDYVRMNGNHQYDVLLEGEWVRVPGVTQINGHLDKPGLPWWAAKEQLSEDVETAWRLRTDPVAIERLAQCSDRPTFDEIFRSVAGRVKAFVKANDTSKELGTEVHALIEHHLREKLGEEVPEPVVSDAALYIYAGFEKWAADVQLRPVAMEKRLCSASLLYAGTIDCLAYVGGKLAILDWKTSKKAVKEPYDEHVLQNIAYRKAAEELGLPPLSGWCVYIPKYVGGEIQAFEIVADPEKTMQAFLGLRAVHEWLGAKTE